MKNNLPKIVGKENILDIDPEVADITSETNSNKSSSNTKHKNYVAETILDEFHYYKTEQAPSDRITTHCQSHKTDIPATKTLAVNSNNLSDQENQKLKKPGYCIVS